MASPSQYRLLHQKSQSSLALPAGSYVYSLCQSGIDALAAISSDNSLRRFDRETLNVLPDGVFADIHPGHGGGVTCVCEVDPSGVEGKNMIATSGRDGTVKLWDVRNKRRDAVLTVTTGKTIPVWSTLNFPYARVFHFDITRPPFLYPPFFRPLFPPSTHVCCG